MNIEHLGPEAESGIYHFLLDQRNGSRVNLNRGYVVFIHWCITKNRASPVCNVFIARLAGLTKHYKFISRLVMERLLSYPIPNKYTVAVPLSTVLSSVVQDAAGSCVLQASPDKPHGQ